MGDVINLHPGSASADPDDALESAVGVYDNVLIIGWNKKNELEVRGNSGIDRTMANWLIDQFKLNLLVGAYEEDKDDSDQHD